MCSINATCNHREFLAIGEAVLHVPREVAEHRLPLFVRAYLPGKLPDIQGRVRSSLRAKSRWAMHPLSREYLDLESRNGNFYASDRSTCRGALKRDQ